MLHQWATLGEFDFVNVIEAPDTATVARVSVALGARGSTKIQTLPALTIDEFVAALGRPIPSPTWSQPRRPVGTRAPARTRLIQDQVAAVGLGSWRRYVVAAATRRTVTPHALPDAKSASGSTSLRQPRKCGAGSSVVQP